MSSYTALYVFAVLGGVFFIFVGILNITRRRRLLKVGLTTEAIVVSVRKDIFNNNGANVTYYPTIEYTTETNETVSREYAVGTSPSKYKEGDKLIIIYDPDKIESFIINDTATKIIWAIALVGGIAITIFGIYFIIKG